MLTPAVAGAIYAGDEEDDLRPVLVSDDLPQSQVAHSLGVGAVNTQALLQKLVRAGVITDEEYSLLIEQLVLLNYWFVQVRPEGN